ncbi:MAG: molybdopterin-containing oxidoreductase family protein [Deltaproteobacteria bacterium]
MKTTRRQFIKLTSIGLGGVSLAGGSLSFLNFMNNDEGKKGLDLSEMTRYPTYCDICFWKCAAWTYVDKKGEIRKIEGNSDDTHCRGRLCPRGTGGLGAYFDEDRLKKPLIRVQEGDKQSFREASWDEALGLVAGKMKEIREKYGPESFALLKHGAPGTHFEHLFLSYGSDTIAEPAYAQCRGPRDDGFKLTFGAAVGSPEPTDIRDAKCMVLIGSHIGENMHNSQVQEVSDAIDKGIVLITVDPRLSTIANKSKYWLPIRPSTDIALLLAWMHVLIYEDLYDREYVERYSTGFEKLKTHVRNFTPEWAYRITDIKPSLIYESAREMAKAAPATIVHPGRHVTWYGDDTQRSRAIAILNALLGSWGRRGGFYFKEKANVPDFPRPAYPEPKWTWKDLSKDRFPLVTSGVTNDVIKASIPDEKSEHQVKAWMVAGTNLTQSVPDMKNIMKAIDSIDFLVVVDIMPMEITGYADVILPECSYLERYDEMRDAVWRTPSVALRMPATEPKYESKPAWWMAKQIGERLGLKEYFNYNDYSEVVDWQLKQMGSSLEEMKKVGVKNFERKNPKLYLGENEDYSFPTPSGKIEFFSDQLASLGFDPIPVFTQHELPPENYFRLIYGRAPMHTFSKTINNPYLSDLRDENHLWINPRVAKIWELRQGQEVWLKNQDEIVSSFPIKVRLTERIRWDSVYMEHGYGHNNKKLSRAYGKGASDSEMMTKLMVDPLMGGTGLRGNFVTILTTNPHKNSES